MRKFLLVFIILLSIFISAPMAFGDELDDIGHQLENLKKDLAESQKATKPLEADLDKLQKQINAIKSQIVAITAEVAQKEKEVKTGEKALAVQKDILDKRTFEYYKSIKRAEASFLNLIVAENLSISLKNFFYQKKVSDTDKQTIVRIVLYIKGLEDKKKSLESEKERLAVVQTEVDKQSAFLAGEVGKAKKYQSELSGKIAQLSARQQSLIASKLASLNLPRSAGIALGGCIDDRERDPGFSPRLAFYTYGVPNRTGMNQFGARGRALARQNEEEILRAYYDNFELKKDYDTGININVEGHGAFNIEDYVKRIYEMPESWPMAALKAQAIVARSFALAYTNNGQGTICTSQQCQVFKPEPKGGAWDQAVNETRGWVMVQGGTPVKAWYSTTHGGYVFKTGEIGWSDTSWTKHNTDAAGSVGSFADLQANAYDKDSTWFYCDWGSRTEYNKTAWLKPSEVADIANVIQLVKRDEGTKEHLYQPDKPPEGTDNWDAEKVRSELRARGGNPFSSVSDVSVAADFGAGRTTSVNVSGDAGSTSFDAGEWKNWFNLRAPANIQIVGPLFNVEKR